MVSDHALTKQWETMQLRLQQLKEQVKQVDNALAFSFIEVNTFANMDRRKPSFC